MIGDLVQKCGTGTDRCTVVLLAQPPLLAQLAGSVQNAGGRRITPIAARKVLVRY
jgi:hypothetical protein